MRVRVDPTSATTQKRRGSGGSPEGPERRTPLGALALAGALVVAAMALGLAAARGSGSPGTLQDRVRAVGESLRCPVCQNLSVADSPSRTAQQMRAQIAAALEAGRTPEEIRAGFVAAYGDWILLAPPKRGFDLVAWVGPAVLLLGGLVSAGVAVRRWTSPGPEGTAGSASAEMSSEDRRMLDRALASDGSESE